jgi:integrase/recombinase XerD
MVSIRLPQGRQRSDPARLLSLAELEAISAVWTRLDPLEKRNRLLLECLSTTDIKVSQLAKLLLSQVNLTTGATSIPRRESKRAKRVLKLDFDPSMTRKLRDFVAKERRDIVPDKDHGYLFPSKTGGGITRTAIWYVRKKARNRAGITRPITANDLRRSFLHLTKK